MEVGVGLELVGPVEASGGGLYEARELGEAVHSSHEVDVVKQLDRGGNELKELLLGVQGIDLLQEPGL